MNNHFNSITEDLLQLHDAMRRQWPGLLRVAIALLDEQTDVLHTFVKSSPDQSLLNHYSVKLADVPSLVEIAQNRQPRIIRDLSVLKNRHTLHSDVMVENFKSSYTEPFFMGNKLLGFIFYDAGDLDYFNDDLISQIQTYSRLIESLIVSEILPVRVLIGMVDTAKELTTLRDSETGKHLVRMARYMVLIATELADKYGLSDEEIEYMRCFAPLHDLGKIAIPDHILLKPGRLTSEEYEIMKTHVAEGLKMVDHIIEHFGFQQIHHVEILKNIIGDHHEHYDGNGYPKGTKGNEISIVGRIAAVADVFDALSSERIYHKAWPLNEVVDFFLEQKGKHFDPECVDALLKNIDKAKEIMKVYEDDFFMGKS